MVRYSRDESQLILKASLIRLEHDLKTFKGNEEDRWQHLLDLIELLKRRDSDTIRESLLLFSTAEYSSLGPDSRKSKNEIFRKLGFWTNGKTLLIDHEKQEKEKEAKLKHERKVREIRSKGITIIDKLTNELSGEKI